MNELMEKNRKVRVNENASDRVIKNRVKKIMEIYKQERGSQDEIV